ncbi:MAG: PulJ/GspJ family protein [Hyphomicrobiaceae bacterium]
MTAHDRHRDDALQDQQAGFTIIELLTSLTILALVLALLGSSVFSFAGSWERQTQRLQQTDLAQRSLSLIRNDLRSLIRFTTTRDDKSTTIAFVGTPKSLRFVTLAPGRPTRPDIVAVNYLTQRGQTGKRLVRRAAKFDPQTPLGGNQQGRPVVILDDMADMRFAYRAGNRRNDAWLDSWPKPDDVPKLIRLRFRPAPGQPIISAVMRVHTSAEQICLLSRDAPCTMEQSVAAAAPQPGSGGRR